MPKKPKLLESGQQLPHNAKAPRAQNRLEGGRHFLTATKGIGGWGQELVPLCLSPAYL
jgi:hypothetical protein